MNTPGVLIAALSCLLSQPAAAEPKSEGVCRSEGKLAPEAETCWPPAPFVSHGYVSSSARLAATLRQIAIYESIDNRDGAAILTAQLREERTSGVDIMAVIPWLKLHDGSQQAAPGNTSRKRIAGQILSEWKADQ